MSVAPLMSVVWHMASLLVEDQLGCENQDMHKNGNECTIPTVVMKLRVLWGIESW